MIICVPIFDTRRCPTRVWDSYNKGLTTLRCFRGS